nr:beta-glucoside-specific PTS transporter subunit IIABC [uncultured Clostridium sp.]
MKKNYDQLARDIVNLIGGAENVVSLTHCITRLRFVLKDESIAETDNIEKLSGVVSVMKAGGQYQVVIGNEVDDVFQAVGKIKGIQIDSGQSDLSESGKMNLVNRLIDTISGIFMPCMPIMVAAGILKAIVIMLSTFGVLSPDSATYTILFAIGDGFFYFMPFFLGASAAKKFGSNMYLGMGVSAAFLYPKILSLYAAHTAVTFIGIPLKLLDYSNTVIPIIFAVYVMTRIEKIFKRIIPKIVAGVFVPSFTLLVTIPVSLIIIGPVTSQLSSWLASGITYLIGICPPFVGFVFGAFWSVFIMFGLHWAVITVAINNLMVLGIDKILPITFPCTFSHAGAALGVALKTKDRKVKEIATAAFFSAFVGSISEPAIYGINLKYKKPFIVACICDGIAGAIIASAGAGFTDAVGISIFTLPVTTTWPGGTAMLIGIAIGFFGSIIGTFFFGYSDNMLAETASVNETEAEIIKDEIIAAPVNGKILLLNEVADDAFSSGNLGKGIAVIPEDGTICAPCNGRVVTAYPHAIGIVTGRGAEVLVHFGLDTVKLNGKHLDVKVKAGDVVKTGDVMIQTDLTEIEKAGYDVTTVILITNTAAYADVLPTEVKTVKEGDGILNCISK